MQVDQVGGQFKAKSSNESITSAVSGEANLKHASSSNKLTRYYTRIGSPGTDVAKNNMSNQWASPKVAPVDDASECRQPNSDQVPLQLRKNERLEYKSEFLHKDSTMKLVQSSSFARDGMQLEDLDSEQVVTEFYQQQNRPSKLEGSEMDPTKEEKLDIKKLAMEQMDESKGEPIDVDYTHPVQQQEQHQSQKLEKKEDVSCKQSTHMDTPHCDTTSKGFIVEIECIESPVSKQNIAQEDLELNIVNEQTSN